MPGAPERARGHLVALRLERVRVLRRPQGDEVRGAEVRDRVDRGEAGPVRALRARLLRERLFPMFFLTVILTVG